MPREVRTVAPSPEALRKVADHLEGRCAGPSLDGYDLVDGLRAVADLLEGLGGPQVHEDLKDSKDTWPGHVSLAGMIERLAAK